MPARLAAIKAALVHFGIEVREPGGGSHWKLVRPLDGHTYPIPAGNGLRTEFSDKYIHGLCRRFGINTAEFRRRL